MAAETLDRRSDKKTDKETRPPKGKRKWPFGVKRKDWPFAFSGDVNDGRVELWAGYPDREDD